MQFKVTVACEGNTDTYLSEYDSLEAAVNDWVGQDTQSLFSYVEYGGTGHSATIRKTFGSIVTPDIFIDINRLETPRVDATGDMVVLQIESGEYLLPGETVSTGSGVKLTLKNIDTGEVRYITLTTEKSK